MSRPDSIYQSLLLSKARGQKQFAILIDPDKVSTEQLDRLINTAVDIDLDYFFVGGSLLTKDVLKPVVTRIKNSCDIPVVLFPGDTMQIEDRANAILLLSLISGRNAELLIGKHVVAAPYLKKSSLEILSTGYMLVDGGAPTTASYMSNTSPIPSDKPEIAVCTAQAGELLGLRMMYLDAGSGAKHAVPPDMIKAVSENVSTPLIVGGGIRTPESARTACRAGADIIVVGNAIEKDPSLSAEIAMAVKSMNPVSSRVTI